jgi:hypothetical protein
MRKESVVIEANFIPFLVRILLESLRIFTKPKSSIANFVDGIDVSNKIGFKLYFEVVMLVI